MGFLPRFGRKKKQPYAALSDEEKMSRYVYLLSTLPSSVIENAHRDAFKDLPREKRQAMFDQLRPFMTAEELEQPPGAELLARLVRRAETRRAERGSAVATLERPQVGSPVGAQGADASSPGLRSSHDPRDRVDTREMLFGMGVMPLVAYQFMSSAAIASYFSVGAGSLGVAGQPEWVGDLGGTGGAGDGLGAGGFDGGGGGVDGGGFGGFDGGGFGGGFDGGGFG